MQVTVHRLSLALRILSAHRPDVKSVKPRCASCSSDVLQANGVGVKVALRHALQQDTGKQQAGNRRTLAEMSLSSDLSSWRSIFMAWFSYSTLSVLCVMLPDLDRPLPMLCPLCGPEPPAHAPF